MNKVFISLCLCLASVARAEDLIIQCGDTNEFYLTTDISEKFKEDYLGNGQHQIYQRQGYTSSIAGRNCGSDSEPFEVLILKKRTPRLLRDVLGPFGIAGADLIFSTPDVHLIEAGLVLKGRTDTLVSEDGLTRARISNARIGLNEEIILILRKRARRIYD